MGDPDLESAILIIERQVGYGTGMDFSDRTESDQTDTQRPLRHHQISNIQLWVSSSSPYWIPVRISYSFLETGPHSLP